MSLNVFSPEIKSVHSKWPNFRQAFMSKMVHKTQTISDPLKSISYFSELYTNVDMTVTEASDIAKDGLNIQSSGYIGHSRTKNYL